MRTLPALVCLLAISGCGGGGNSAPAPSTGTLEAGGVLGVYYASSTQSGFTDANGTFTYLPGETVTFWIGAVELGSVPGAAKISLFTLAGLTPPSSEVALRRELERARRQPTPLVRAMNLARLLIALDADNNPDNGIDVSGRAADLGGRRIDLGLGLSAFATSLDRLAPNLTRNIPTTRTLTFAYEAANLTVASHNPVRYDANDGTVAQRSSTVTYLPNGARSTEESSSFGLSQSTFVVMYSWDALGRLAGISAESAFPPGGPPNINRSMTTYDARGNRVAYVIEQQFSGLPIYRSLGSGAADARGLFPETTYTVDSNGDGSVDSRQVTQTTFDANGNPVANTASFDDDNDGVFDSRHSFTDTFDANGRLQAETYETDADADGTIDSRALTTVANDGPNAVVRTVTQDYEADGVMDERSTTRWVYDNAGNSLSITGLDEHLPDGTVYGFTTFTMTYDGENRLLSTTRVRANEVGGIPTSSDSATNIYDDQGNLTRAESQYSNLLPENARLRQVIDHEYGPNGERTMFRVGTDFEADGTIDFESATQVTNQNFDDGVLALAQQYFEFGGAISLDYTSGVVGGVVGGVTAGFARSQPGGF